MAQYLNVGEYRRWEHQHVRVSLFEGRLGGGFVGGANGNQPFGGSHILRQPLWSWCLSPLAGFGREGGGGES